MALAPPLKLTRDQLASFLKDQRQIRAFENLFGVVEDVIDVNVEFIASNSAPQNNTGTSTDYIDLPINGPHVTQARRVQWNEDDGTVDIGLYGGSVLQVGQEIMYYAKNTSGVTITNGTPVMFSGTVGSSGKLTFTKAVADGSVPSEYMMGAATQDIENNAFGYITSFGLIRGWNTTGAPYGETWNDGDLLYFDPATPGTWTKVKPAAPNIHIPVAVVIDAGSGGSGSIFMRMQIEESVKDLQDVELVRASANGQVLVYNTSTARWENNNITQGTNIAVTNSPGGVRIDTTSTITAVLRDNSADLIKSTATLSNGAGANVGTLNNAPTAGNPTKWVAIDDNGTTRYIPAW